MQPNAANFCYLTIRKTICAKNRTFSIEESAFHVHKSYVVQFARHHAEKEALHMYSK
jgi:hypothetical protein